jgi:RNA polymerase sigma-70 factor (ECF subfamily)
MLGDLDDAEDVTQDSFIRAYRSLERCQEPIPFQAWLFKILVNRCRTASVRRRQRRRLFMEDDPDSEGRTLRQIHETPSAAGADFEMDEELNM